MSDFKYYRPDTFPPVIRTLIIINVIVFVAQNVLGDRIPIDYYLALWPINSPPFKAYQVITHMFVHGSIWHIAINMYVLWGFGRTLESFWGSKRFFNFYIISGIGAALLHLFVQYLMSTYNPAVGASGAIMGVLVGFAYLFPNTELYLYFIPIPIKAKWLVTGYVLLDLFSGVTQVGDNIAHFAHLGGAITGFILVLLWNKTDRKRFY